MINISTIKSMMAMVDTIDELRELNLEINKLILDSKEDLDSFENLSEEELDDLIDDEYKKATRKSIINTREYYWILTLRTIGVQITYERAKEMIEECIDMSIDFDTKHPYDFLEEDIIETYNQYYNK